MKIIMDGKEVAAERGQTIVEVARRNGVYIPTLCHVPALEPAAMCRICTVELAEGRRSRLVTACNYPLRGDAEIHTDTPLLRNGRKVLIELLAPRCQGAKTLAQLAERYGADLDRFPAEDKRCIMCGLCARVCERVGGNVLALCGRGVEIQVDTSFGRLSPTCIGCGSCARICPVEAIRIEDVDGERRVIVRGKEASRVPLRRCSGCGCHFGPVIDLGTVLRRAGETGVPDFNRNVCPACSRRSLARRLAERHYEQYETGPHEPAAES
ncbi:MAG TPA: 2Fe-2S iron-sulfur cluster-binding protein [Desulfobacterales bacterium]|nr:2Fe-2S iron-sulfur cluster-binding protein [Desulfobacterales bacterium]